MIVKIFEGVATHFPARRSEWIASVMMMGWGFFVSINPSLFDTSPSYAHMARMADEPAWAFWAVLVGASRFVALSINGTFHDRWYSKFSPHVRALMSLAACFLWVQLFQGLYGSGTWPPGLAIYAGLAVSDLLNAFSATGDAAKSSKAAFHEPD